MLIKSEMVMKLDELLCLRSVVVYDTKDLSTILHYEIRRFRAHTLENITLFSR